MSDPVLPLGGAQFKGIADITEVGPQGFVVLRGDLAAPELHAALKAVTGLDMPDTRRAHLDGSRGALWMSPDELAILVPYTEVSDTIAALNAQLDGAHVLVADLSDSRAHFRISGIKAREVVAKLAPVDMSPDAFGPGEVRRTRFAQVAAGFWMPSAETVHVFCFRSVAEYMFDLLSSVAGEGSEVGYFRSA